MKDKHINIAEDSALLKQVYQEVSENLVIDKSSTAVFLVIKFVCYFSLALLAYGLVYFSNSAFILFSAYIVYGFLSVLLGFNFAHDFCHHTIFKNRFLNNIGFISIYALVGAHAEAWKFRHIHSHHYAPNVKDYDSDLEITSLIRVEPGSRYRWFHRFQHYYAPFAYTSYSFYWVFIKDFVIYFKKDGNPLKRKTGFHISFWVQKIFYMLYLLILPVVFSGHPWFLIIPAFLAMHLLQSLFLLFTFFMTHHVEKTAYFSADEDGYIRTSWFANQVKTSNDFYPFSRTANFIFGGFNNHIAHHLFPHIHHVHYPKLNRLLYKILADHHIEPNVTTFFGGAASHLRHLRNLSAKP